MTERRDLPLLTTFDLVGDAEEYRLLALDMTSSDPLRERVGRHGRIDHNLRDVEGRSKAMTYMAAQGRRMGWFNELARRAWGLGWRPPASARIRVEEPGKVRYVFDQAESRRLVTAHVEKVIRSRVYSVLLTGQVGGIPLGAVAPEVRAAVGAPGATNCDLLARRIQGTAHRGHPFLLGADLIKAFDRVERRAVVSALRHIGLDRKAARWVASLCLPRYRTQRGTEGHRRLLGPEVQLSKGIEQGGSLSALLMNLVLAEPLRQLCGAFDCVPSTYIDDLYVQFRSREDARRGFHFLQNELHRRGVGAMRPLGGPDDKASTIIDIRSTPAVVLRRYLVTSRSVGSTTAVLRELNEEIGPETFVNLGYRQVAKRLGMHTLDRKCVHRARQLLLREVDGGCTEGNPIPPPLNSSEPKGGREENEGTENLTVGFQESLEDQESIGVMRDTVTPSSYGEGKPKESLSLCTEKQGKDDFFISDCNPAPEGADNRGAKLNGSLCPTDTPDRRAGGPLGSGDYVPAREGSHLIISVREPSVADALRNQRHLAPRERTHQQRLIADLGGLGEVLGESATHGQVRRAVHQVLKRCRYNRQVRVRFDPRAAWTCDPGVLGGPSDTLYRRIGPWRSNGELLLQLHRSRRSKRKGPARQRGPLPAADLLITKVRPGTTPRTARVRARHRGRFRWFEVPMTNASPSVRPFEAAARIVKQLSPNTVAVSTDVIPAGFLAAPDGETECYTSAATGITLAIDGLSPRWAWESIEGGWSQGKRGRGR